MDYSNPVDALNLVGRNISPQHAKNFDCCSLGRFAFMCQFRTSIENRKEYLKPRMNTLDFLFFTQKAARPKPAKVLILLAVLAAAASVAL
jgi:hypothetical protein